LDENEIETSMVKNRNTDIIVSSQHVVNSER